MTIPNDIEQSRPKPLPQNRSTKARRPIEKYAKGSDGENDDDSSNDTNCRQYDNTDLEYGQFSDGDTVGDEEPSRGYASLELEGSDEVEQPAEHVGRKRKLPRMSDSDSDSFADRATSAQVKASGELGHTALPDDACGNRYLELLDSLAENLQCIRKHRMSTFGKDGTSYFELECLLQDGAWYWIAEFDIQRYVPSAVGTLWGCGPEDWVAPKTGEKETGRQVWRRPLATDVDGVPDGLIIMGRKISPSGRTQFLMQKIGYPGQQPTWYQEDKIKKDWPYEYERYLSNGAKYRETMNEKEPQLVAIVGHRLNGEKGIRKQIQLSCQWTNGTETWEVEDDVQRKYNAAVLTYWQSDPKARSSCNVPDRRL